MVKHEYVDSVVQVHIAHLMADEKSPKEIYRAIEKLFDRLDLKPFKNYAREYTKKYLTEMGLEV